MWIVGWHTPEIMTVKDINFKLTALPENPTPHFGGSSQRFWKALQWERLHWYLRFDSVFFSPTDQRDIATLLLQTFA